MECYKTQSLKTALTMQCFKIYLLLKLPPCGFMFTLPNWYALNALCTSTICSCAEGVCDHFLTLNLDHSCLNLDHSDRVTKFKNKKQINILNKKSFAKKAKLNLSFSYCCRKKRCQCRNSWIRPDWCENLRFWPIQVKLYDCFLNVKSSYFLKNTMPKFSCCTLYVL